MSAPRCFHKPTGFEVVEVLGYGPGRMVVVLAEHDARPEVVVAVENLEVRP